MSRGTGPRRPRLDLASTSKQFTATAILVLQGEGLLSVDDPVSRHINELPAWADALEQTWRLGRAGG